MINWIIVGLIAAVVILLLIVRMLLRRLRKVSFQKGSLSTKYGKMTEQFLPFLAEYPYDPQNFRFLGTPVDGVQFADDEIVFVEFKTAGGQLNGRQKQIRELVESKKVRFEEIKIK